MYMADQFHRGLVGKKLQKQKLALYPFCYDSTHSDAHLLLTQEMNKSDKEKQMEEEVSHE